MFEELILCIYICFYYSFNTWLIKYDDTIKSIKFVLEIEAKVYFLERNSNTNESVYHIGLEYYDFFLLSILVFHNLRFRVER